MKMDLSNWIRFNPKLKILNTNRLFYNRHLYRLTYHLGKARFIRFLNNNKNPPFFKLNLTDGELQEFIFFKNVLDKHKQHVQFRIENSTLNVFSNDLALLDKIAHQDLANFISNIFSITVPKSNEIETALLSGCYVSSLGNKFKFRVVTKSKFFKDIETKHFVGKYLKNLGSEIRIGKVFLTSLNNTYKYVHQGYFYCNDKAIVDLINLIDYNFVARIEDVVLPN